MFSETKDASKCALIHLAREVETLNYALIDCQLHTAHLERLGAELISRDHYLTLLKGEDE
jgi:leucyl/phenylalanyl-tRNA--protein transferase